MFSDYRFLKVKNFQKRNQSKTTRKISTSNQTPFGKKKTVINEKIDDISKDESN